MFLTVEMSLQPLKWIIVIIVIIIAFIYLYCWYLNLGPGMCNAYTLSSKLHSQTVKIFFNLFFILMCMGILPAMVSCIICVQCLRKPEEGIRSLGTVVLDLCLSVTMLVLGLDLSSRRATNAPNHCTILPTHWFCLFVSGNWTQW